MAAPRISVVIPALNEEHGVVETIKRIPKVHEIIVVDGGSKDGTAAAAEKAGARVIVEKKRGYGLAHKTGFTAKTFSKYFFAAGFKTVTFSQSHFAINMAAYAGDVDTVTLESDKALLF